MIKKYLPDIIETISKAVQIKTVLDTPVEGGPFGQGNKDCLEYVLSVADKLGFRTVNLDGYCGYAEIGEGDEIVGIIGHLDVVPEGDGWKVPAYSGALVDDEIWGRGTIDDKGPTIISMYVIKALMDEGMKFDRRVRIIFGCNEETGSRCMEHYLEVDEPITYGVTPDSNFPVIFAEKSINNIFLSGNAEGRGRVRLTYFDGGIVINAVPDVCRFTLNAEGMLGKVEMNKAIVKISKKLDSNGIKFTCESQDDWAKFVVYGKAAHGSVPQHGVNAVSYALDGLDGIIDDDFVVFYNKCIGTCVHGEKLGCFAQDEYGKIAVNIGLCHYEDGKFEVRINSRLPFNTNSQKMVDEIKSTVGDSVKVDLKSSSQGFKMDKDSKMIKALMNAYATVTGDYESQPICSAGGTYAREFSNCVAFGPEMDGYGEMIIHEPNERISLRAIEAIFNIYHQAYRDLISL
ncbi:MAG: Sapep family Mn(2+)-dependent dipeptidase [Clostridia bacterium]|nr:Sapep family Mn(2+)-dependent dipeptidase [Clostridia bacterium]